MALRSLMLTAVLFAVSGCGSTGSSGSGSAPAPAPASQSTKFSAHDSSVKSQVEDKIRGQIIDQQAGANTLDPNSSVSCIATSDTVLDCLAMSGGGQTTGHYTATVDPDTGQYHIQGPG